MKKTTLLLFFVFTLLFSFSQNYKFENQFLECIKNDAEEHSIDLHFEFNRFEDYLLEQKVLSRKNGKSYYQIFEKIREQNEVNFPFTYSFYDSVGVPKEEFDLSQIQSKCEDLLSDETFLDFQESKLYKLGQEFKKIDDSEVNPKNVASAVLKVLTPKDFNEEYYQWLTLIVLAHTNVKENVLNALLPRTIERLDLADSSKLIFRIDDHNMLLYKSTEVNKEEVEKIVQNYVNKHEKDSYIELYSDPKTKFKKCIEVQNIIMDAIKKIRTLKSRELYAKEFSDLTDQEKATIIKLVPSRIIEKIEEE